MIINITEVRIKKIFKDDNVTHCKPIRRAISSVTYCGGAIVTNNIEIWENEKGLCIRFPHVRYYKDGCDEKISYNITHPTSNEARKEFEEAIISEYNRYMSEYNK